MKKLLINHTLEKLPSAMRTAKQTSIELMEKNGIDMSRGRLKELANAGMIPHYTVDNGEPIFRVSEVKEWIAKNMLKQYEGRNDFKFEVLSSIADITEDRPPDSIIGIDGIQQLRYRKLCGIYFLVSNNEVVYVGQSKNIDARIYSHKKEQLKEFENVFILTVPSRDLDHVEINFIKILKPKYNVTHNYLKGKKHE